MAIRITNFGGLVPKASARALPGNAAQVAQDLQADTVEFRPLADDSTAVASSGVNNPKTIHRLARKADGSFNTNMTTGWIIKAGEMSFVKAQINDDTTERTYATFDDGNTPPWVYDATDLVTGRQLGVPHPASAPTAVVNVVDEFSTDDRAAAIQAAQAAVKDFCTAAATPVYRGSFSTDPNDYSPGTGTPGWVDRSVTASGQYLAQVLRVFRLSSTGGAFNGGISNTYADDGAEHYQWVLDPSLGGSYGTSDIAWPSWAGTNNDHWFIQINAYGLTYTLNQSQLHTDLLSMEMPGADPPAALMTSEQADEIVAKVAAFSDQQWTDAHPLLDTLYAEMGVLHSLLGGGGTSQRIAALTGFYAQSDVSAEITSAVANCAQAIWSLAVQAHASIPYTELAPGGA